MRKASRRRRVAPKKKPAEVRKPLRRPAKPKAFEACERPVDDPKAWPPRHDQVQCRSFHEGLTPPARQSVPNPLPDVRLANQDAFLDAFAVLGSIRAACRTSGVCRRTVYNWRESDALFRKRFEMACDEYADMVDEEMHERGIVGWDEPIIGRVDKFQDGVVTLIRRKSDAVLLKLAARVRPEKYATKRYELTGRDGAPLIDPTKLNDEQLEQLEHIVSAAVSERNS